MLVVATVDAGAEVCVDVDSEVAGTGTGVGAALVVAWTFCCCIVALLVGGKVCECC